MNDEPVSTEPPGREKGRLKAELQSLKRQRVLDEARQLFWQNGYTATTFAQIASGLGVTKPFLYSLFPSKAELLAQVCLTTAREVDRPSETGLDVSPLSGVGETVGTLTLAHCRHHLGVGVTLTEAKSLDPATTAALAALRQTTAAGLRSQVEGALASTGVSGDAPLLSLALIGMVGWIHNWFRPEGRASQSEIAAAFGTFARRACGEVATARPEPNLPALPPRSVSSAAEPATSRPAERDRIVATATRLFYDNGYTQTTLDELSHALGVAKPALYDHFPGKQSILDAVCLRGARLAFDAIRRSTAVETTPTASLVQAVDGLVDIVMTHHAHVAVSFRERRHLPPAVVDEIRTLNSGFDDTLRDIIARGVASGEFDVTDVGLAALAIAGAVCWMYTWYDPGGAVEEDAIRVEMARFAMRVVAATPVV